MTGKILIIAGEPSGDRLAAELVSEIKKQYPQLEFSGIGGTELEAQGTRLLYHLEQLAFLGLTEIIKHIPFIRQVFRNLLRWIREEKPAAVILVDYPGFNLRFAKKVKKYDIPVIYYISPQLWAWGQNRVTKMKKYVDLLLVIFKFEEEFYRQFGIEAHFVGHPLVDRTSLSLSAQEFQEKYTIDLNKRVIALLPGSRLNEVKNLLPEMVKVTKDPQFSSTVEWLVGKSASLPLTVYSEILKENPQIKVVEHHIYPLMKYSYAAMVASGTATLETGYFATPMIVLYRVSPLTYHIGKFLVKIKNIAMANIVLQETAVPELIQGEVHKELIVSHLNKFLNDPDYYQTVKTSLGKISRILGPKGAAQRAAGMIKHFLDR
jgi:lipid-A-disaccharide synthase